jgi:hypothetical protein
MNKGYLSKKNDNQVTPQTLITPSETSAIRALIKEESTELTGYQMRSADGYFSFNTFAAEEPQWDRKDSLTVSIPVGPNTTPIQCSFSKTSESLGGLLSRVNLGYSPLGLGEIKPGHYGPYPTLYTEKLYDRSGMAGAYAVKMIAIDLEHSTMFCLHRGSGYKKSFFIIMDEIGKTLRVTQRRGEKRLTNLYLWSLRFNNFPRGIIIERHYRRDDGLREIVREQSEIYETAAGSESLLEKVIQIKDPKIEGSLMFYLGRRNGQKSYQLALKREGINFYSVRGDAAGKKVQFNINAQQKMPDLEERREVLEKRQPKFSYSIFSPRHNPIDVTKISGKRFGDPKTECLYMVRRTEGVFEYNCNKSGRVTKFLPKRVLKNHLYSGRLIYDSDTKRPLR